MLLLLEGNTESESLSHLLQAGTEVNIPADTVGQDPAHLAAHGGHPFFLLWQLQTGANLNQQDCLGEAPIHKAAKVGSLECLALLVSGRATINLCNKKGQTAEDLALAFGFGECAQFLKTVKETQNRKVHDSLRRTEVATRPKRASESRRPISKKTMRTNDPTFLMSHKGA
ncbi:ankyrin repeat domain-containing protein 37 [Sphaerodactylus townsendi]|uniref:Ankyrin repeat domain-containing protein 37 n=1 Tax=Sphaerodactylus townsendi TaxID=933632 RepID=A0ACB8E7F5_9SAUR|nr:ankyrin repeat domain-containing protein 37 [Sphaerodactylus townsendi]